jgi:hypothetical protein
MQRRISDSCQGISCGLVWMAVAALACSTSGSSGNPGSGDSNGCMATVADDSTCITDQAAAYNQVVPGLASCATVTRADFSAVWAFMTDDSLPASCTTALDNKCPGPDFPTPR